MITIRLPEYDIPPESFEELKIGNYWYNEKTLDNAAEEYVKSFDDLAFPVLVEINYNGKITQFLVNKNVQISYRAKEIDKKQILFDIFEKYVSIYHGINKEYIHEAFDNIVREYESPGRFYHNLEHLYDCINNIEFDIDHQAVIALFYHDVIYDTHAKDNEERSAEFAKQELEKLNIPSYVIPEVQKYILSTKHDQEEITPLGEVCFSNINDLDLLILASDKYEYDEYSKNIRKEYSWVRDDLYYAGRLKVLRFFLNKTKIYHSRYFSWAEKLARENIEREIQNIQNNEE